MDGNLVIDRAKIMEILYSAFKGFEKMIQDNEARIKPWMKEELEIKKINNKSNWYKSNKNEKMEHKIVLFVPLTPGGLLAKQMKMREKEINRYSNERIKIVGKSGQKI